jgi:hypothetical protein
MISRQDLRKISRAKLKDAEALFAERRYDAAVYLCGYAIECSLKARIVTTLKWKGFPETGKEFEMFRSFKTHHLETLLALSGQQDRIYTEYLSDWTVVNKWNPENRYLPAGSFRRRFALDMIHSSSRLITAI